MTEQYLPIFETTRANTVETIHYGAVVVVDSTGRLSAWQGDPQRITYMRSSAKPLQALPFIEIGGDQTYHLTSREIAIICASHDGTDMHVEVIRSIQTKADIDEGDLLCGTHDPMHKPTAEALKARTELPTPNRHNCSGKHSGMLAYARMLGLPIADYINPDHPIQENILTAISEMCSIPKEKIALGIDGCSAPVFAMPLYHAAWGYARLSDPRWLPPERAAACRRITSAMIAHPEMVGGEGRFDTRLMQVCEGRILAKGGAQGYLALGVMAGARGSDSPGIGITIKISDGDREGNVRPAVALDVLQTLGVITEKELAALEEFGPAKPVHNWRKIVVGESHPLVRLERADGST